MAILELVIDLRFKGSVNAPFFVLLVIAILYRHCER